MTKAFLIGAMAVLLSGCQQTSKDKLDALSAAGFVLKTPRTKTQADIVRSLPPYQMSAVSAKGKTFYVMPGDPKCSCAYVGDQQAFSTYKNIRIQQKISDQELAAAQINQDARFDMDMDMGWGPYYGDPFFY